VTRVPPGASHKKGCPWYIRDDKPKRREYACHHGQPFTQGGITELAINNKQKEEFMQQPINIIFDGPPGHDAGCFVEVETDDGKSVNAGKWIERDDGLWALRITELPKGGIL